MTVGTPVLASLHVGYVRCWQCAPTARMCGYPHGLEPRENYLKLALVSCPIALHAASSTAERIAFRKINKATGNRLPQQLIDEGTREPV